MKTSWWIGLFFVFMIAQLMCITMSNPSGTASAEASDTLTQYTRVAAKVEDVSFSNPVSGIITGVQVIGGGFTMIVHAMAWDYPEIFQGDWVWFKILFLLPLSFAVVATVIFGILRITS